jgi:photosystem II protein
MSDRRARRDASASSGAAKSGALSAHDDDDRRRLGARARGRTSEMRGAMNANAALPARAATRATSRRATTRTRRASMTSRKATTTRTRAVGINDAEKPPEETVAGVELQLGRAAMLGFLGTTVGDVLTRGDGPIEQLGDEFSYVARHVVNPVEVARDALEVAGFYVESVVLIWFLLGGSLLLGFWQGARSPIKTVSGKSAKQRAEAAFGEIEKAYETTVREQKPYELFNGRLAMLGTAFAFVGDVETGGLGPLEQVQLESGIPIIDEEIFALVFLAGVSFNVVATGVTAVRRAYVKGRE